jgi:hypothetical protein
VPVSIVTLLVVAGAAVVSTGGFLIVSRCVPSRWLVADADAASALYATIGMVYAILIAIAAIAVWEPRSEAAQSVDLEATSLTEAAWSASDLSAADASKVRGLVLSYLAEASGPEWSTLRDHRTGDAATDGAFARLRMQVAAIRPATDRETAAYQAVSAQVSVAAGARRARLAVAGAGMPGLLWPTLIIGGLVSILFLYLFGLDRTFPNGLMMAVVGGMIALLLFVIYQVEFPFSRAFAVSPASLISALDQVQGISR